MAAGLSATPSRTASHTSNTGLNNNRKQEVSPLVAQPNPNPPNKSSRILYGHSHTTRTTNSRQSGPLLAQLEAGYLRSLDAGGSERVSPGVLPTPIPVSSLSHIGQVTGRTAADRGGDTLIQKQAVVKTSPSQQQDIPGHCPVINLRPLNHFVQKYNFKMEGTGMLRDLLQASDWMCSIDLKDVYLSVSIYQEHRRYLRFTWMGNTYEFTCLPFGLISAPRIFTKLLKPVMALLWGQGLRTIIYLDDTSPKQCYNLK